MSRASSARQALWWDCPELRKLPGRPQKPHDPGGRGAVCQAAEPPQSPGSLLNVLMCYMGLTRQSR